MVVKLLLHEIKIYIFFKVLRNGDLKGMIPVENNSFMNINFVAYTECLIFTHIYAVVE
jgi:hypothetical protein